MFRPIMLRYGRLRSHVFLFRSFSSLFFRDRSLFVVVVWFPTRFFLSVRHNLFFLRLFEVQVQCEITSLTRLRSESYTIRI